MEGALGIGGDGVGELDEFVEVGVGEFEVVELAFEGFDGVEHWLLSNQLIEYSSKWF